MLAKAKVGVETVETDATSGVGAVVDVGAKIGGTVRGCATHSARQTGANEHVAKELKQIADKRNIRAGGARSERALERG